MRAVLIAIVLLALTPIVQAERCEMVGGCVGNVWYMHVPHTQLRAASLFRAKGLPLVNARVQLARDASLLYSNTFTSSSYHEQLKRDLEAAAKKGESLSDWGATLRSGSRVRILSYVTFPQLETVSGELFALVL